MLEESRGIADKYFRAHARGFCSRCAQNTELFSFSVPIDARVALAMLANGLQLPFAGNVPHTRTHRSKKTLIIS